MGGDEGWGTRVHRLSYYYDFSGKELLWVKILSRDYMKAITGKMAMNVYLNAELNS